MDAILPHPDVKAVSFVGSTPIATLHLRDRHSATASGCRRWAVPRITRSSCPTPISRLPPRALIGAAYGSAGERCMAVSVAVAVGDAGDPLCGAIGASAHGSSGSGPAIASNPTWGRSLPVPRAIASFGLIDRWYRRRRRRSSSMAGDRAWRGMTLDSSSAPRCSTTRVPT